MFSPSWITRQRRDGVVYVPPTDVYDGYMDLAHTADVLARSDLAEELRARVNMAMCRRNAPVLAVLRLLARDPLEVPLPALYANAAAPTRLSPHEVWNQAMAGMEDVADFSDSTFDTVDTSYASGAEDATDPRSESATTPPAPGLSSSSNAQTHGRQGGVRLSLEDANVADDASFRCDALRTEAVSAPESLKRFPKLESSEPRFQEPSALSSSAFVRELRLTLLGMQTLSTPAANLSRAAQRSVWDRFDLLAEEIAALPADRKRLVHEEILSWQCATVLQLYAKSEHLRSRLIRTNPTMHIDTEPVMSLLRGESDAALDAVPALLLHARLVAAARLAYLARRLGHPVRVDRLRYESPGQWARLVDQEYIRIKRGALPEATRARVRRVWASLAGVFLAQDARMLLFLELRTQYNGPVLDAPSGHDAADADATALETVWPRAPFAFTRDFVPYFLDPETELGLAEEVLSILFPSQKLLALWQRVVNAFSTGDQEVELEMRELASAVDSRIESAATPPFI